MASRLHQLSLFLLLSATGCASTLAPQRDHLASSDPQLAECAEWFRAVDAAVVQSGVGDIGARRVDGFPYLRIDRFLVALKAGTKTNAEQRRAWVDAMRDRDRHARSIEFANLPQQQVDRFTAGDRDRLALKTEQCAAQLLAADRTDDRTQELLYRQAYVADDYSRLKRAFGLYELTRLPFYAGVSGWQESVSEVFGQGRRGKDNAARYIRYQAPAQNRYNRREVAEILSGGAGHQLGLVSLTDEQRDRLFATYAPVIEIETEGNFDRIGGLYWTDDGKPQVDVSRPVVYRRLGYTRVQGRTLLQLVYTAWMPQRPLDGSFDVLGGHLDGIVWRVTLAPDGEPLLFDSIHPCGCYHMFFPTARLEPLPAPEPWTEWAFIPTQISAPDGSQTVTIALQTRTHYLVNVTVAEPVDADETYRFADYDELRSMPLPAGGRRSLFGPDGLVAGSERGERFLFWPMGIASPGAMRQAGTQATAFVGRRHFDDADLVEKRFRLRY